LSTQEGRTLFFDFNPLPKELPHGYRVRYYVYTVPGQAIYAAAKRLGMLKKGTAKVEIIALGKKVDHRYLPENYYRGNFFVQVGAFRNKFNAYRFRWRVYRRYRFPVKVVYLKGYYRVLVGPVRDYRGAVKLKGRLREKGLHGSFILRL
jgi:rare lipoprotein A